jgi:hypothetical protein
MRPVHFHSFSVSHFAHCDSVEFDEGAFTDDSVARCQWWYFEDSAATISFVSVFFLLITFDPMGRSRDMGRKIERPERRRADSPRPAIVGTRGDPERYPDAADAINYTDSPPRTALNVSIPTVYGFDGRSPVRPARRVRKETPEDVSRRVDRSTNLDTVSVGRLLKSECHVILVPHLVYDSCSTT